jgi:translation elongation factor P/translation initiation factor 5A
MDNESFEQILLNSNLVVMADLMKEGQEVEILIWLTGANTILQKLGLNF